MKIFITGGTGAVGTAVTQHLIEKGHDVLVMDLKPSATLDVPYVQADIMDTRALAKHMTGYDAVAHLAAYPSPAHSPNSDTFQVNVAGTFNVFEVAASLGIKRIVQASSINALGCFWGNQEHEPQYLPMDEAHPTFTTDAYSFSKEMVEDIAAYYWRREGISSLSLRFPGVYPENHFESSEQKTKAEQTRSKLDAFAKQDKKTRQARFKNLQQTAATFRGQYRMEYPKFGHEKVEEVLTDPLWSSYLFERMVYWSFVTTDDAAQSFEKGLRADFEGSQPLFINNHRNSLGYDSQTLAELFYPEVKTFKQTLKHADTLISIDKARALIGFEPREIL